MSKVDLHIHSSCSDDGDFSPVEIVSMCEKIGMRIISITDHNSVRAVEVAQQAAKTVRVVAGVELDCSYQGKNFHLLGYGFDASEKAFFENEADILKQEQRAAVEKIRLFRENTGIPLTEAEVLPHATDGVVTGELIAEILLQRADAATHPLLAPYLPNGEKSDMPNVRFYWDFFSEGKIAYVPINYLTLPEAIAMIKNAGGIAVLAHPGQNLGGDDKLLKDIISEKIDGIEVFSSYHSVEKAEHYLGFAVEQGLLVTCGSDFHGKHKPNIALGAHGALWEDEVLMNGLLQRLTV